MTLTCLILKRRIFDIRLFSKLYGFIVMVNQTALTDLLYRHHPKIGSHSLEEKVGSDKAMQEISQH